MSKLEKRIEANKSYVGFKCGNFFKLRGARQGRYTHSGEEGGKARSGKNIKGFDLHKEKGENANMLVANCANETMLKYLNVQGVFWPNHALDGRNHALDGRCQGITYSSKVQRSSQLVQI